MSLLYENVPSMVHVQSPSLARVKEKWISLFRTCLTWHIWHSFVSLSILSMHVQCNNNLSSTYCYVCWQLLFTDINVCPLARLPDRQTDGQTDSVYQKKVWGLYYLVWVIFMDYAEAWILTEGMVLLMKWISPFVYCCFIMTMGLCRLFA